MDTMTPEQVYDWCREHKQELLDARDAGDSNARTIISTYNMMVRFPERIALTLLTCAVEERIRGEVSR